MDGTVDSPPCLRLTHRTFGSQNAVTELLFLRLSMPVQFHETFKVGAGTTPLTRTFTIPEEDVKDVEPDSEFEVLRKSASRKEAEEAEKDKAAVPAPPPPKEPPRAENEKDAATEKSKIKRGSAEGAFASWGGRGTQSSPDPGAGGGGEGSVLLPAALIGSIPRGLSGLSDTVHLGPWAGSQPCPSVGSWWPGASWGPPRRCRR